MKKIVLMFTAAVLSFTNQAKADRYPILESYKVLAERLIDMSKVAQSEQELRELQNVTRELVGQGVELMKLYANRNPNCAVQFSVFLDEVGDMETKSLAYVHERYHDGTGLPEAPKHCYFGRSQVVHPVMNLIRMKEKWDEDSRQQVIEDLEEVIEHLARIQRKLDNPPM